MPKINAIIVEDEPKGVEILTNKLEEYCPDVNIIAACSNGESAIKTIRELNPDLIFLDIDLGSMTGFDVLDKVGTINFEIIFTTSHSEFGIKAIKANALDFLLKPIDNDELIEAVDKVVQKKIKQKKPLGKLMVPISNGVQFIKHDEILYCEADNNCTWIHFIEKNKKKILVVKTLAKITEVLPDSQFLRSFRSYTINLKEIETLFAEDGRWYVILNGGQKLRVNLEAKEIIKQLFSISE